MLAWEPTATKKKGALIRYATAIITDTWIKIQIIPTINKVGLSNIAIKSICIPMVATKTYSKTLPNLDAPTPSRSLALVKDKATPPVVARTTIQKKVEVNEY